MAIMSLATFVELLGDGRRVLFGNGGPNLVFSDLDGNFGNAPANHFGTVSCVAVSPDGKRVLSGGTDWQLRQWDLTSWQDVGHFAGHTDGVLAATYLTGGERALSVGSDRSVWRWEAKAGKGGAPLVPGWRAGTSSPAPRRPRSPRTAASSPLSATTPGPATAR